VLLAKNILSKDCTTVAPGQSLNGWQKTGLELVSRLHGGRDVVLAIDLTESVGLNDEGKIRLRQLIEDSLKPGDTVYVVPFASTVNPTLPEVNPLTADKGIPFQGKKEDVEKIIQEIPFQPDLSLRQTDIQSAELFTYRGLTQLNQCRLADKQGIKPQSVVWLTDAPLMTQRGITSQEWAETPASSPFRQENSPESQERESWIKVLPLEKRSVAITTDKNQTYNLTVVDIPPTVQEFCTPAPGGAQSCLVTPYLIQQLWLPATVAGVSLLVGGIAAGLGLIYWLKLKTKWKLKVEFESGSEDEQICYLKNNQKISIGEQIPCPGDGIRAYLERKGNELFIVPTKTAPIYCQGSEIYTRKKLDNNYLRINCPQGNQDFEFTIKIVKKP